MRVLNLLPDQGGGIESYYEQVKKYFTDPVTYFIVGKRREEKGKLQQIRRMVSDYRHFLRLLKETQYDVIVVNPSLDAKGIVRDGIFLLIAKRKSIKTIIFFHGWLDTLGTLIQRYFLRLFRLVYGQTDAVVVLSERIRNILISWGFRQPIYVEITSISDDLVNGFSFEDVFSKRMESQRWRLLFLSRILRQKGIYETIDAWALLKDKYSIDLLIAGDGKDLASVKRYVRDMKLNRVSFYGYVVGKEKDNLFKDAHLYCLPSYTEGMPVSVVEAMAYGLPVVTRWVGRLPEFFRNGEHGFATNSKNPEVLRDLIERLYQDKKLYHEISSNNHTFAKSHFLASEAASRLEKVYASVTQSSERRL